MRTLWFSNTPGSGAELLGIKTVSGGWVKSLDKILGEKTELSVVFYLPKPASPFVYNGINYFPIVPQHWKLTWLKNRIFTEKKDTEDLGIYLNIIKEFRPDIIHIHGTENPFGSLIGRTNIPIVVSVQGNINVYHHKYFSGLEKKLLFKNYMFYESIYNFPFYQSFKKDHLRFSFMAERERRNLKKCRYIIGRTSWDRRITRILAPESVYFHCDEILRDVFYNKTWRPPRKTGKIIIHTTNGNSPFKGFETVCQVINLLNDAGVDFEWRVAGIRETDLIVKLVKRMLGEKYPSKCLVLLGNLGEYELAERLLEANMYVMPSHIENSPNNLCEAMMLGMPCIATYAGGTGSLLKDGEEGILIQDGDPWVMAGAIIELISDPEKAVNMGQKARERALLRHDKNKVVNDLLNIYSKVIELSCEN